MANKRISRVTEKRLQVGSRQNLGPAPTTIAEFAASNAAHFDNYSVDQFAYAMRIKLAVKRQEGRGGWHDKEFCSAEFLSQLLREHVEKGDPVDVANFCMMLHQRDEGITPSPQPNLRSACEGIADDYMTSERHHPGYVLIPTAKFEAIRAALATTEGQP